MSSNIVCTFCTLIPSCLNLVLTDLQHHVLHPYMSTGLIWLILPRDFILLMHDVYQDMHNAMYFTRVLLCITIALLQFIVIVATLIVLVVIVDDSYTYYFHSFQSSNATITRDASTMFVL